MISIAKIFLPGRDDGDSDGADGDHGHRASRLSGLHIVLVSVDRPKARLEVVVVVVISVVVRVHNNVAHLVEGHEHEGKQIVSVKSKVAHAPWTVTSLGSFHSFNISRPPLISRPIFRPVSKLSIILSIRINYWDILWIRNT